MIQVLQCLLPCISLFSSSNAAVACKDAFDDAAIQQYASIHLEGNYQKETVLAYDGTARYELVSDADTGAVYDLVNNEFVLKNLPLKKSEIPNAKSILLLIDGKPHLFETDGKSIEPLEDGFSLNGASYDVPFQVTKIVPGKSDTEDEALAKATKIPNYEYFFGLGDKYGLNDGTLCTMVAAQIVMGYYDAFLSDDIVPEDWDVPAYDDIESPVSWKDFDSSPGTGGRGESEYPEDSRMLDHLVDICTNEVGVDVANSGGATISNQRNVIDFYLGERGFNKNSYSIKVVANGDRKDTEYLNLAAALIKKTIDEGRPIFANGRHHATVAFAYDEKYVYVESGWGYVGKTEWATFQCDGSSEYGPSAMDLKFNFGHTHSDNYVASDGFYCSCGAKFDSECLPFSELGLPNDILAYSKTVTTASGQTVSYSRSYSESGKLVLRTENSSQTSLKIDYGADSISAFHFHMSFGGYTSYVPDIIIRTKAADNSWSNRSKITLTYSVSSNYVYLHFEEPCYGVEISSTNSGPTPATFHLSQPIWRNI